MRLALTCLFLLACLTGCESPDDRIADDRIADERIDAFFAEFTSTWIRANPDMAVRSGYFSGAEQDSLEQQLTPRTRAFELEVIGRARDGLLELEQYVS
ncbi:MAG: hypothetical protein KJO76_11765, partial [Gammaproteobacteria bacterium]|nr:hypothetical protein [Gammaproteobacteria bacterium]